ncbi:putative progesterone immunomodulatory-binding factor 1 [Toxoplasma gondii TgCatPRC2]|uniref:Putative progesterone immunomodulatory-binding factor 1 n=1 Tax=Toxoplasma gondii TgCatPRC2 TaxID=1130821 RepID=A0A151H6H9_TOXGO|nr:putative progesterone immunomodulatory-binding factor 1 [Toxoplasma gondii TgCatPRC2]
MHEKEVSLLKDRAETATRRVELLERKCESAEAAYQEVLVEYQNVQSQLRGELMELSAEVKMRAFENERLSLTCEDNARTKAKFELEKEMLQKKIDVLREELTLLQKQSSEESARDRAKLVLLREKLAAYETMEQEVDAALNFLAAEGKAVSGASVAGTFFTELFLG